MKKYKIHLILASFFTLIVSCDDELEIINPNSLASEAYYTNESQAIASVDAIYNALMIVDLMKFNPEVLGLFCPKPQISPYQQQMVQ